MRILISAYACLPHKGSESAVGLETALVAAREHAVWVLTRSNNVEAVEAYVRGLSLPNPLHVIGTEARGPALRLKRIGRPGVVWYYRAWQRHVRRVAIDLDQSLGFDLVHHVTFASYWTTPGVVAVGKPMVWGPVGGAVGPPIRLVRELGARGILEHAARSSIRRILAPRTVRALRESVNVALVQNAETGAKLSGFARIIILPNATVATPSPPGGGGPRRNDIAVVGRLVPWKAGSLALRTLSLVVDNRVTLTFYGSGPDEARLRRLASRLGLASRVTFAGRLEQEELWRQISTSGVVLHPSLHEEAGLAVTEALSLGTPVVALDRAGPKQIARRWPDEMTTLVPPGNRRESVERLAAAVTNHLAAPLPVGTAALLPVPTYHEQILEAYELAITQIPAQPRIDLSE